MPTIPFDPTRPGNSASLLKDEWLQLDALIVKAGNNTLMAFSLEQSYPEATYIIKNRAFKDGEKSGFKFGIILGVCSTTLIGAIASILGIILKYALLR